MKHQNLEIDRNQPTRQRKQLRQRILKERAMIKMEKDQLLNKITSRKAKKNKLHQRRMETRKPLNQVGHQMLPARRSRKEQVKQSKV